MTNNLTNIFSTIQNLKTHDDIKKLIINVIINIINIDDSNISTDINNLRTILCDYDLNIIINNVDKLYKNTQTRIEFDNMYNIVKNNKRYNILLKIINSHDLKTTLLKYQSNILNDLSKNNYSDTRLTNFINNIHNFMITSDYNLIDFCGIFIHCPESIIDVFDKYI